MLGVENALPEKVRSVVSVGEDAALCVPEPVAAPDTELHRDALSRELLDPEEEPEGEERLLVLGSMEAVMEEVGDFFAVTLALFVGLWQGDTEEVGVKLCRAEPVAAADALNWETDAKGLRDPDEEPDKVGEVLPLLDTRTLRVPLGELLTLRLALPLVDTLGEPVFLRLALTLRLVQTEKVTVTETL